MRSLPGRRRTSCLSRCPVLGTRVSIMSIPVNRSIYEGIREIMVGSAYPFEFKEHNDEGKQAATSVAESKISL